MLLDLEGLHIRLVFKSAKPDKGELFLLIYFHFI